MAVAPDLTIYRVRLANNATHTVKIEYKYYLDANWTFVASGIPMDSQGYLSPSVVISGLTANQQYYVRATDEFCGVTSIESFVWYQGESPISPGQWLISAFICEQEGVFISEGAITGLSSPAKLMYDPTTELMFGIDYDDITGSFFFYDPLTATTKADIAYIQPILQGGVQRYYFANAIDRQYRKLYMAGSDTDGLQIYNIATGNVTVVPYGYNVTVPPNPVSGGGFNRTQIYVFDSTIVVTDVYSAAVYIIDRITETVTSTIPFSSITNSANCFLGFPLIFKVGNEYWVTHNLGNSTVAPSQTPNIYRYNLTFSNTPSVIDLTAYCTPWTDGAYTRLGIYLQDINALYLADAGGNKVIRIDTTTFTVTTVKLFNNRSGKSNASMGFVVDPITNDFYISGGYADDVSDGSPILVSWRWNTNTDVAEYFYENISFSTLERVGSTSKLHGTNAGSVRWSGNPGWDTDGSIPFFNKEGDGTENTGVKIGTELEFNDPPIPPGTPTGNTKPNSPSDPDYIPPSEDLDDCEVTFNTDCPDSFIATGSLGAFVYEFSLKRSVTENPVITRITVAARISSVDIASSNFILPNVTPQYFQGSMTVAAGTYDIDVRYFDEDDNLVQNCAAVDTVLVF